jgi:hypothetical protein
MAVPVSTEAMNETGGTEGEGDSGSSTDSTNDTVGTGLGSGASPPRCGLALVFGAVSSVLAFC